MPNYIDGFVFPLAKQDLDIYQAVAEQVAAIWKEHGALAYFEYTSEGDAVEGCPTFEETLPIKKDEIAVFGWITFSSKASKDEVFNKVANDSRMQALVAPIMQPNNPVFDPKRMVYGSFKPLIQSD